MSFFLTLKRVIDRQWIRDGYSGSPTLLHRALFFVPIFLMLMIAEIFGLDRQSDITLYLFLVAMFASFLILGYVNWRWFAGFGRTKRWERISRKRASAESSIDEARP